MSSSDQDILAAKPTEFEDDDTVSRMSDPTKDENLYYMRMRLWDCRDDTDVDEDIDQLCSWRSFLLSPGIFALLGLPVLIVGVWALVQGMRYFSIAMLSTTFVIIVSALLVTASMVLLLGGVTHILFVRFSGVTDQRTQLVRVTLILLVLYSLPVLVVALGITAAALIPSLSETTQLSANTTFNNYLSDQSVQGIFDNIQHNLKCCGVLAITDYESIFNNLSVPVSCCNTTNPLANETTCSEIVSNAQQANQIGLIYSEGCVHQLQSVLHYILSVVAVVSIMVGMLQIIGNCMPWCICINIFCLYRRTQKINRVNIENIHDIAKERSGYL